MPHTRAQRVSREVCRTLQMVSLLLLNFLPPTLRLTMDAVATAILALRLCCECAETDVCVRHGGDYPGVVGLLQLRFAQTQRRRDSCCSITEPM